MKIQKLFLTSALCMCAIMPAFADIASDAGSATCESDVIGATSGTTALEADWTAIEYECAAGTYLNLANQQCTTCPAGSYCEGGTYTMDDEDPDWVSGTAGQYLCTYSDEAFPLSAAGNDSLSWCYRNGTVSCSALNPYSAGHGTASYANANASYKAYSDWGDQDDPGLYANGYFDIYNSCAYTLSCDAGYTATTPGVLAGYVYATTLWREDLIRYKSINGTGSNWGNQTGLQNGQFEVKWTDGTTVSGTAMCSSTNGGSYATVGTPDTSGSGDTRYCWCNMDSYSVAGGATQNVASPSWVFRIDRGSASSCANDCANDCANYVQGASDFRSALFGSLGANPVCQANNITIEWYNQDSKILENQCTYDGTVTLPATPSRAGYIFGGWKVRE